MIAQPTPYVSRSRDLRVRRRRDRPADRARLRPLREGVPRRGALGRVEDHAAPPGRDQVPPARRHRRRPDALPDGEGDPRARPGSPEHRRAARLRRGRQRRASSRRSIRDRVENDFMILELLDMIARGAAQGRAPEAPPRRPARGAAARAHLPRARVHHPGRDRGRVRAPRARHLPPRHQAGEHPRQAARSEPARLADEGQARRLQRRQGRRRRPRRVDDAVPGGARHALLPEPRAGDQHRSSSSSTCTQGSPEVEFFEDFYIDIYENDTFSLFNRNERYSIAAADRARKKHPAQPPVRASRARSTCAAASSKSVGRPADIYSLGAVFYYLISGAYANPKNLYDAFRKFIEYEQRDENNTIAAYIEHEYRTIQNLRAPKAGGPGRPRARARGSLLHATSTTSTATAS